MTSAIQILARSNRRLAALGGGPSGAEREPRDHHDEQGLLRERCHRQRDDAREEHQEDGLATR